MSVMMILGAYPFSISTAAYQKLQRTSEYTWSAQDRVGQYAALQYTGPGKDSITLNGVIYPDYKGGTLQLTAMRTMAELGKPLLLIGGNGFLFGNWVIESISEGQSIFAAGGTPKKQEFSMVLRKYDNGPSISF